MIAEESPDNQKSVFCHCLSRGNFASSKNADYPMKTTKTILSLALAVYFLLAFLCVLMTYFGVNLFLGGMHAYA